MVDRLAEFAQQHGCTVSQLAVAWALANPAVHVAIVGSRRVKHIEESIGALDVELSAQDLDEIDGLLNGAVELVGPSPEGMP